MTPTQAQANVPLPADLRMNENGTIRVIVQLRGDYDNNSVLPRADDESRRQRIANNQAEIISRLGRSALSHHSFVTIPALAVTVDTAGLQALQQDPLVARITIDGLNQPTMAESTELIGSRASNRAGFGGKGMVVAVLDTGVQHRDQATGELRPHKMLQGRVSTEACFSSHDGISDTYTSLCKNNRTTQTFARGAAAPCIGVNGCSHGTHVAATIAGNAVSIRDPYSKVNRIHSGVAPQAKIIAIQVFTKFNTVAVCGSSAPCVSAYDSDIIAALEWLYDNFGDSRFGGTLVAANMSLGGSWSNRFCDRTSNGVFYKNIIDRLRTVRVATVIAAGNNGFVDGVSSPGCISSAITVGASITNNAPYGISDRVASFSNSPAVNQNGANGAGDRPLDLYAPGDKVTSAIPTGSTTTTVTQAYDTWSGTSMAAPHVAGAWAVIRSAAPNASVTQVLNWLRNSGKKITNQRSGVMAPRINVNQAVTLARNAGKPHTLSTRAIEFGKVGRGKALSRVVTVRNNGTTAIRVGVSITGTSFSKTQTCRSQLAAKSRCTITVRYAPTVNTHLARHLGALRITFNGVANTVGLAGTTTLFALSPAQGNFGKVAVNTNKTLASVRLFNYSNAPIRFSAYSYDWDGAVPRTMENFATPHAYSQYPRWNSAIRNHTSTISAGGSALVLQNVTFRPTYGKLPTSLGIGAGEYNCNPYPSEPNYGSCIDRPAIIYFIVDPNLRDGTDCAQYPFNLSCRWLRFPMNGTAVE
ncbi:MAG: S8 family serine peptidase [Roseiflexaceae bacterium]